jgi:8-oxo-dGTP pyrophosphatase MutT (NUDIX family)
VVVVRRGPDGWRYLVLRCYRNWDFPKGLVEPGEAPLAAALRETREETTLDDLVLRWGEDFRETAPYAGNKIARYYVAESPAGVVDLPVSEELGRPEHHEFRWVDEAEARRLLRPRLEQVFAWAVGVVEAS